jgi:hypothetical protein
MQKLGTFEAARAKVLADVEAYIGKLRALAGQPVPDVESGVRLLYMIRGETSEDLNQIQHENLILRAAQWLLDHQVCPSDTVWEWNPRQGGGGAEPDLRGSRNGTTLVSAEIATSKEPKGTIDARMRSTLEKLSRDQGEKYYFVCSEAMRQRASTKISKAGWRITPVALDL